ncbi:MAG TPA: hypothetical protein VMW09_01775 [Desulfatiglandales bacterium]|nr:hypothetical protein [Desulfatiglandales bacterium]
MVSISKSLGVLFLLCVLLISIALIIDDILISRENNAHINKEIYTAFREIEHNCVSQPYFDRSKRCQIVLDMLNGCIDSPEPCSADEYYKVLKRIGFDLPSFYALDYVEKIPMWKFWLRFSKNNKD